MSSQVGMTGSKFVFDFCANGLEIGHGVISGLDWKWVHFSSKTVPNLKFEPNQETPLFNLDGLTKRHGSHNHFTAHLIKKIKQWPSSNYVKIHRMFKL